MTSKLFLISDTSSFWIWDPSKLISPWAIFSSICSWRVYLVCSILSLVCSIFNFVSTSFGSLTDRTVYFSLTCGTLSNSWSYQSILTFWMSSWVSRIRCFVSSVSLFFCSNNWTSFFNISLIPLILLRCSSRSPFCFPRIRRSARSWFSKSVTLTSINVSENRNIIQWTFYTILEPEYLDQKSLGFTCVCR